MYIKSYNKKSRAKKKITWRLGLLLLLMLLLPVLLLLPPFRCVELVAWPFVVIRVVLNVNKIVKKKASKKKNLPEGWGYCGCCCLCCCPLFVVLSWWRGRSLSSG